MTEQERFLNLKIMRHLLMSSFNKKTLQLVYLGYCLVAEHQAAVPATRCPLYPIPPLRLVSFLFLVSFLTDS